MEAAAVQAAQDQQAQTQALDAQALGEQGKGGPFAGTQDGQSFSGCNEYGDSRTGCA